MKNLTTIALFTIIQTVHGQCTIDDCENLNRDCFEWCFQANSLLNSAPKTRLDSLGLPNHMVNQIVYLRSLKSDDKSIELQYFFNTLDRKDQNKLEKILENEIPETTPMKQIENN